jgi:hypothetical protein
MLHHVTTQTTVEVDYDCPACGFAGTALVRAEGIGTATSFVVVDRDPAREAAAEESAEDAVHQAKVTAALLPCPRCRRRSRAVVAQFVIMTVLGVVALLALAVLAWRLDEGWRGRLIAGVLAIAAIQVARRKHRHFKDAEARVEKLRVRAVLPRAVAVQGASARPSPAAPVATPAADSPEPDEPPADGGPRLLR